jgi:hypothetical protein
LVQASLSRQRLSNQDSAHAARLSDLHYSTQQRLPAIVPQQSAERAEKLCQSCLCLFYTPSRRFALQLVMVVMNMAKDFCVRVIGI